MQAGFAPAADAPPDVRVQVAERIMQVQGVVPDPFFNPYWMGGAA